MKLFKKEKKVVALLNGHALAVGEVMNAAKGALSAYFDGAFDGPLQAAVDAAETEADRLRREIQDTLYAGAYLPHLREDIYQLVESVDDIGDAAEACTDFFGNQKPEVPEAYNAGFRELAETSLNSYHHLQVAIKAYFKPKGKLDDLRKHCAKVGVAESEVDGMEQALTTQLFESDLELAQKIHLQQCIRAITEASDRAEDAADLLDRVAIKSVV